MIWLKKEILFILSVLILGLSACKNDTNTENKFEEVTEISITHKITHFFNEIEKWNMDNVEQINQLGKEIIDFDSTLQFYPNNNDFDYDSFIFSSLHKENLNVFKNHPFLEHYKPYQYSNYKVWRKEINNKKLLDLSIEPHPVLHWIFVIRKRNQE